MKRVASAQTRFIYHNVGQGLFYSADLRFQSNNMQFKQVHFMYDCGSKNKGSLKTAIERYKISCARDKLDLLIISHLHDDHVSGLNILLSSFKINKIILPYLSPIERLIVALSNINMPNWYYVFLADPVSFLLEKGVKQIIIIGGETGEEKPPPDDIPMPENNLPEDPFINKLADDPTLKERIITKEANWGKYIDSNRLIIKNHKGFLFIYNLWTLRFFNYQLRISEINKFRNCFMTISNNNQQQLDIKDIIKNKNWLRELKSCYMQIQNKLANDFNNTSLILYHGPLGKTKSSIKCFCFNSHTYSRCLPCRVSNSYLNGDIGQFLTGDTNLNFKYSEIKKHFFSYFNTIFLSLIPHHGSQKNWNSDLIVDTSTKYWIVSAGLKNQYGHPHFNIIYDILLNRRRLFWVNEYALFLLDGKVYWV